MFRNIVLSAVGAGLVVCLAIGALQIVTTTPLILHAEVFETAADAAAATEAATPAGHSHDDAGWQPGDGMERTVYTFVADLVTGVAVSLILLGAMVVRGDPIDARRGLAWGVAGFVAASLLPSLGLPPELPGTPAADLLSRQTWWLGTAAASALGIYGIVYARHWAWRAAGLGLLIAPHVIGAPAPPAEGASYPAELAGEFVVASILISAVLWSLSGLGAGWLYQRLAARG